MQQTLNTTNKKYHKKRDLSCSVLLVWEVTMEPEFSQWANVRKHVNCFSPRKVLASCNSAAVAQNCADSGWKLRIWKPGGQFSETELHQSGRDKEKSKHKPVLTGLEASKAHHLAKRQRTGFCTGFVSNLQSCLQNSLVLFHLSETMNKDKTAAYCQSHLHTFWCYYTIAIITFLEETSRLFCLGVLLYHLYFYRKVYKNYHFSPTFSSL